MNVVKLIVQQNDYTVGEYGELECEPQSIKVTVIRLYRALTQEGLKTCKDTCEANWGRGEYGKIDGRVTMTAFADDAALGRLYKLVHWYNHDLKSPTAVVKIESIESMGKAVVAVTS